MQPKYKSMYHTTRKSNTAMIAHIKRMEEKMDSLDQASQLIDELIQEKRDKNQQLQREYDSVEYELGQNIGEIIKLEEIQQAIANDTKF